MPVKAKSIAYNAIFVNISKYQKVITLKSANSFL